MQEWQEYSREPFEPRGAGTLWLKKVKATAALRGNRIVPAERTEELRRRLRAGILYLRDNMGITTFYTGDALGFDSLAAEAVIAQREELKGIRLVVVMPCRDQAAR